MLPEQDWLALAKRLAIGMHVRVLHKNERRANMVVANAPDRWWAYCQRCHEGGVVMKDHVKLTEALAVPDTALTMPADSVPVWNSEFEEPVERFLLTKNMSSMYLPALHYSASRKRLLMYVDGGWHGRDTSGNAPAKWMNYQHRPIVELRPLAHNQVVVEDLYSAHKVAWALKSHPTYGITCALGTAIKPELVKALMCTPNLLWMFDADKAGDDGADFGVRRMRPFVHTQSRVRPPEGLDPKDMSIHAIRAAILGDQHG